MKRVTSGSSQQPRLVSDWLAAVDLAASMDELDHSGFVFDKQVVKFQTHDKKITNGSRKTLLTDLERKLNFSEEAQYKNGAQFVQAGRLCARSSTSMNSGTYDELEPRAQCGVVQRQPQDVQPNLGRNIVGCWE